MTVTGPDFIALQVRDLERAADFYSTRLGLRRAPASPPGAVVFATEPVSFAVREPLPGLALDAVRPTLFGPGPGPAWRCGCMPTTLRRGTTSWSPLTCRLWPRPSTGRSGERSPSPNRTVTSSPSTTSREH